MQKAFVIKDVIKKYPDFQLGPLNLELNPGVVLGYVGPNGSGKTTTMHCMTGLVKTNSGNIEIFGQQNDPKTPSWKEDIGYVGDVHPFYERWTATKNLKFLSQFYSNWSDDLVARYANRFDIPLEKKVKSLSTGNRVKLSLISALAYSPKLLILDEPTAGLDPVVRAEVLDAFFEVVESGKRAIFYSTHILSDISRIADELAFLRDGNLIMRTGKEELNEKWRKISFSYNEKNVRIRGAVEHKSEGKDHQIISSDLEKTISYLKEIGAENIIENRISIDEIAVQILKNGGKNVESA
ncbi:ABC transporter ATP-binding protein [candidate division KSB1 bacterium]